MSEKDYFAKIEQILLVNINLSKSVQTKSGRSVRKSLFELLDYTRIKLESF